LRDALDDVNSHVGSIYNLNYAIKFRDIWDKYYRPKNNTKYGDKINMIFTMPIMPVKCPGAPQKILYLTTSELINKGGQN